MQLSHDSRLLLPCARAIFFAALLAGGLYAQPQATTVNQVLAILTVKDGVVREDRLKVMPPEVRETVQLYLDGKIQQWFSRGDQKGVVFILNCKSVAEAKAMMEALPLSKANMVTFDYLALGPLMPLTVLLGPPAK